MSSRERRARVSDIHEIAAAMPKVTRLDGPAGNAIYQVGKKSFVFFRTPRPDAKDPVTGERLADVIVFWVGSEDDKRALVADASNPFFTTDHFNGHPSVLVQASRIGEVSVTMLREVLEEAWLSQAGKRAAATWLADNGRPS
jgi:hypothetical protein